MQLFPRVYLGNKHDASNPHFINSHHIYHILNVTDDIKNHFQDKKQIEYRRELEERGLRRINELVDEESLEAMSQRSLNESSLSQQDSSLIGTSGEELFSNDKAKQNDDDDIMLDDEPDTDELQQIFGNVKKDLLKGYEMSESLVLASEDEIMETVQEGSIASNATTSTGTAHNAVASHGATPDNNAMGATSGDTPAPLPQSGTETQQGAKASSIAEKSFSPAGAPQKDVPFQPPQFIQADSSDSSSSNPFSNFVIKDELDRLNGISAISMSKSSAENPPSFMQPEYALRMEGMLGRKVELSDVLSQQSAGPDSAGSQQHLDPTFLTQTLTNDLAIPVNHQRLTLQTPKKASSEASTPKKTQQHEIVTIEFSHPVTYKRISIKDSHDENIFKHFDEASDFIDRGVHTHLSEDLQSSCLVHCREGKSRSVSCLIAYAMKKLGWSLDKAYNHLEGLSNHRIRVNDGFKRQLMKYERVVFPELEENSLDFFPKDRNKRSRDYADLYQVGAEYEMEESSQGGTKRRRTVDPFDDDMAWTPELEKRRRRQQQGLHKFMDVNHSFVQDDGRKQLTLLDMFKKPTAPKKIAASGDEDAKCDSQKSSSGTTALSVTSASDRASVSTPIPSVLQSSPRAMPSPAAPPQQKAKQKAEESSDKENQPSNANKPVPAAQQTPPKRLSGEPTKQAKKRTKTSPPPQKKKQVTLAAFFSRIKSRG
uniref:protein-tyrosine-phosphatase n=1 Tax=Percolomonas cosmopolitus TaxID=63605 RepID=A0A7S1KUY8_9EUKA|mmetsp:Transcript_9656/g.35819  ORF Transcript_9656/g.35819 Transcript_9656/m.35819 type:complete len:711 (+) Transcript_9656:166-2298(+)|eukprot:CAMPEP_0117437084 /NCGR_PEP_ID=MMETSP0759-20121206/1339_1 /TAXON_ID=63605 /ORGANISM="Percolomonas cosmopolitus, Strain WS" /LENGTH=710 /DNA_ID=CAMNT_0005228701 /DNA_START=102 /DNA_END=2234 /DNA_ORIENTATION=+